VIFGMVAATGARVLTGVNFKSKPNNLFIVAMSVGFGMIPLVAPPAFFHNLPGELQPLLEFGILLSAVVSVILNVFFHGLGSVEAARSYATAVAASAEHV
jgi:xanthine/uracil permease